MLPDISRLRPFKAVVVLNASYTSDWQDEVSKWLVTSGCLYMMAWGPACTTWDDSVDWAVRVIYPGDETPDEKFVMTTWHDDESLEEVFWFAQFNGSFNYNDVELVNALILDISDEHREDEMISLFDRSYTLADREPEPENDLKKGNGWFRRLFSA